MTESERIVPALMAQGANNETIAQQLSFSSKTVRKNVSNIFSKLQVANRAQAIIKARQAEWDHEDVLLTVCANAYDGF